MLVLRMRTYTRFKKAPFLVVCIRPVRRGKKILKAGLNSGKFSLDKQFFLSCELPYTNHGFKRKEIFLFEENIHECKQSLI